MGVIWVYLDDVLVDGRCVHSDPHDAINRESNRENPNLNPVLNIP